MAHKVEFSVPERQLGKRDIVFRVSKDDALFGTLRVSKGGVDWFPLKKTTGLRLRLVPDRPAVPQGRGRAAP